MFDYADEPITPEGRARLDKYGSTLTASTVKHIVERIADYPEIIAAVHNLPLPESTPAAVEEDKILFGWGVTYNGCRLDPTRVVLHSPGGIFRQGGLQRLLERYVSTRGIPMPHYTSGSKITEEAQELRDALLSGDRQAIMEETADVAITAAVMANQFGFTVEEAIEHKIAKDRGRGCKVHGNDPCDCG